MDYADLYLFLYIYVVSFLGIRIIASFKEFLILLIGSLAAAFLANLYFEQSLWNFVFLPALVSTVIPILLQGLYDDLLFKIVEGQDQFWSLYTRRMVRGHYATRMRLDLALVVVLFAAALVFAIFSPAVLPDDFEINRTLKDANLAILAITGMMLALFAGILAIRFRSKLANIKQLKKQHDVNGLLDVPYWRRTRAEKAILEMGVSAVDPLIARVNEKSEEHEGKRIVTLLDSLLDAHAAAFTDEQLQAIAQMKHRVRVHYVDLPEDIDVQAAGMYEFGFDSARIETKAQAELDRRQK